MTTGPERAFWLAVVRALGIIVAALKAWKLGIASPDDWPKP